MGTGFTWETQNPETDKIAANKVWQEANNFLADPNIHLVLLDALTYRRAIEELIAMADTVSVFKIPNMPLERVLKPDKVSLVVCKNKSNDGRSDKQVMMEIYFE
jgi:ATP:corrinoid adenosyltransferase